MVRDFQNYEMIEKNIDYGNDINLLLIISGHGLCVLGFEFICLGYIGSLLLYFIDKTIEILLWIWSRNNGNLSHGLRGSN